MTGVFIRIKIKERKRMKTQELLKILKKNECYLMRHGNSHDIWFSQRTNKQFTVPRHKAEIKTGTLRNIWKEAGIK